MEGAAAPGPGGLCASRLVCRAPLAVLQQACAVPWAAPRPAWGLGPRCAALALGVGERRRPSCRGRRGAGGRLHAWAVVEFWDCPSSRHVCGLFSPEPVVNQEASSVPVAERTSALLMALHACLCDGLGSRGPPSFSLATVQSAADPLSRERLQSTCSLGCLSSSAVAVTLLLIWKPGHSLCHRLSVYPTASAPGSLWTSPSVRLLP